MNSFSRTRLVATLLCSLASTQCVAHARTGPNEAALTDLNRHARAIYALARGEIVEATDPILLVFSIDKMVLVHNGAHKTFGYVSPKVEALKIVAHTALATWTLLDRGTRQPAKWRAVADNFATEMNTVEHLLAPYDFDARELAQQRRIIDAVAQALRMARNTPTANDARAFAQTAAPLVMANVSDAAQLLLEGLNTSVTQIKSTIGPEAFSGLRVIIVSGHMARDGEHAAQYFQALFGGEPEGRRWAYAENVKGERDALDALGMHLIDNAASTAFFGDETRLHRDVLSDAARAHLATLTLPTL